LYATFTGKILQMIEHIDILPVQVACNYSGFDFYRPNLMRSISGWDDYKISFVCLFVCLGFSCVRNSQISSNFDQTWYVGSEREGKGRFRVWYKSDINFRFYAAILDFGLLQH
jgi:hypothetical protein